MKNILITGGAVHAKLDDVKIITNKFRGGMMAELADKLSAAGHNITYITSKLSEKPKLVKEIIFHDGIWDYRDKVLAAAKNSDAVILGAAVANLIPVEPFKGKFPSHNYKPGDTINIPFTIAPRIIDEVKKVNPKTCLIGFKLLSGVSRDVLIDAAYEVLLGSKATIVFANDTADIENKFAVTKEKSIIPVSFSNLSNFILDIIDNEYYHTVPTTWYPWSIFDEPMIKHMIAKYEFLFKQNNNKYFFGTIAKRADSGFYTTIRGKNTLDIDQFAYVRAVDHISKTVYASEKVTLNAPLLAKLFENPHVEWIVHTHKKIDGLPIVKYEMPGTVKDTMRDVRKSFNIQHHGCFLMFDKEGRRI